jgi:hypothetical protein
MPFHLLTSAYALRRRWLNAQLMAKVEVPGIETRVARVGQRSVIGEHGGSVPRPYPACPNRAGDALLRRRILLHRGIQKRPSVDAPYIAKMHAIRWSYQLIDLFSTKPLGAILA